MPRYFTLAEAQAALPRVAEQLHEAMALKTALDEAEQELRGESQRIQMSGGALVRREKLAITAQRRESVASQLRELLTSVQEQGCLVKDLDSGLLDFPTLYHGEEVYLCWKAGEPAITFWHAVSAGFRGRRPIDQEFLDNHRGGE